MSSKKVLHYVDNQKFYDAIVNHRKMVNKAKRKKEEPPRISNYIGECLFKIASHLSYSPNFINYTFRDEMISDGIENCLLYFNNFNPKKSKNPFTYFTTIIWYAFIRRINREQKSQYVKYKIFSTNISPIDLYNELANEDSVENNVLNNIHFYDNMNEFIVNFERKQAKKKKSASRKKRKNLELFYKE
jgi:hypothetical protein